MAGQARTTGTAGKKTPKSLGYRMDGMKLKEERIKRRLTLTAFSERSGIAYSQIWKIENGETQCPRFSTIEKIAKVLDIDPNILIIRN